MNTKNLQSDISLYRSGIMGLSIISVMLFHQYFLHNPILNLFHNYGYWGVDVFLFLSGMGMVRSLETHSLLGFYKRRFRRIVPACCLCGSIKYIVYILMGSSVLILKDGLHLGWRSAMSLDLWYINTILLYYLFSPFLYKALSYHPRTTLSCVFFAYFMSGLTIREQVGFDWTTFVGILAWSLERLPVFTLGMFFALHDRTVSGKTMFISSFSLITAILVIIGRKYVWGNFSGQSVIVPFALTLGMLALLEINIQLLKRTPSFIRKRINHLGTLSLEIYIVHEFVFSVMMVRYHLLPYVQFFISLSLSLFIAYLCREIITEFDERELKTRFLNYAKYTISTRLNNIRKR